MRHPNDLYSSPEKERVRRELWLPAVERAVAASRDSYPWRKPRYLTVCGPQAWDIDLFVNERRLFDIHDVVAIDANRAVLNQAKTKHPALETYEGRFEQLVQNRLSTVFPFDVINADLNGNCFDETGLMVPGKLRAIERVCQQQAVLGTSFTMLLTFEGSHQTDRDGSDRLVVNVLRDHATRLGLNTGYFRLARYGLARDYHYTMLEVIPSVIVRFAGEQGFDARLDSKVTYRPSNYRTKVQMIGFVIECRWDGPPISLPRAEWSRLATPRITLRQRESVEATLADVAAPRTKQTSRGRGTRKRRRP